MSTSDPDLTVAERFYFIAHDDRVGRARLHPRAIALGSAAALLGELVLLTCIGVHGGMVRLLPCEAPDRLPLRRILDDMAEQVQHREVRVWLPYLAEVAADSVELGLGRAGHLRTVRHRRLTGVHLTYEAADPNVPPWQTVRLAEMLNGRMPMYVPDLFLAGLVDATGLTRHVLWDHQTSTVGLANLPRAIDRLSPPLRELVDHTRSAVGHLVLAPR